MKSVSYKILLKGSINGVQKIPSKIAWIQGNDECLLVPCYKENEYIVIELIPGCVGSACIEGWALFDDVCADCEPIYFKKCFCNAEADCADCENCIDGICVPLCTDTEFCKDDKCIECDPDHPCPNGKICINGRCVCPQGYFEKDGRCVQCDENTVLTKCQECKNGLIIEKPCDGKCDPTTGQCIDCLVSGDCFDRIDGRNCCNTVTKKCECCPGTKWSPEQNKCIPILCSEDSDCGDPCLKCTEDGCQPIICPEGFKCWNGECVEWPCISTSCDNGGDCGPSCGCVEINGIKQCVPCHILECLGLCEQALGCKCSTQNKCVPVDNCNDYCDGMTPCLDPKCTCYNNQCINCENFPCSPDDCSSRQNCGCTDGDCGGGFGCNDKLTVDKIEDCTNTKGCAVKATFESQKDCKCESIRVDVKHQKTQTTGTGIGNKINDISIVTELFKGNIPYVDHLNRYNIGDNELVEGTIKVTINHYKIINGIETKINPTGLTPVANVSIVDNKVSGITLKDGIHFRSGDGVTGAVDRNKVEIIVFAENVRIPNNACIEYGSAEVWKLIIPSAPSITSNILLTTINGKVTSTFLNDDKSNRSPLFIWSKSNDSTFSNIKYKNDGTYNQNGFFRKVYGVKVGNTYVDTIDSPEELKELVNNYNYKVQVDCGCKANATYLNKLLFCCPKDVVANFDKCNKKLSIDAFNVCSVNGDLKGLYGVEDANYILPEEVQTNYYVKLERESGPDLEFLLNYSTQNKLFKFIYDEPNQSSIVKASIIQRYVGGLLAGDQCEIDLKVPAKDVPSITLTQDCNFIDLYTSDPSLYLDVLQPSGAVKFNRISFYKRIGDSDILTSFRSGVYDTTVPTTAVGTNLAIPNKFIPLGITVVMRVYFTNGCSNDYDLIKCPPKVTGEPLPTAYAKGECANGENPTIVATSVGFTDAVQYSLDGITYQSSPNFENKGAGIYTLYAKEEDIVVTTQVEILEPIQPTLTFDGTLCGNNTVNVTITGSAGSTFGLSVPPAVTSIPSVITIGTTGTYIFTVGQGSEGVYTATLINDPEGRSCTPTTVTGTLVAGGEILTPTIVLDSTVCVGNPLGFRIEDGGKNATYLLTASGGSLGSTTLQATQSGFNGTFIPSATNAVISISNSTNECNTVIPTSINVTSTDGPLITAASGVCDTGSTNVVVTANVTGTPTLVTIGGVTATLASPGTYQATVPKTPINITVIASNTTCTDTFEIVLPNCDCDPGTITIESNSPTCGEQNTQVYKTAATLGFLPGSTYQWYEVVGGVDVIIGGASGNITGVQDVLPLDVFSTGTIKTYKLKITKPNGCEYFSNTATVQALNNITPTISGLSSINTGQSTTYVGAPIAVGNTYQWKLSNNIVTDQVVGSASNLTITFTVPGLNILTLTVTTANGCMGTISKDVNVLANCSQTVVATLPATSCGNITSTVSVGVSGSTIVSHRWLSGLTVLQSGGSTVLQLDTTDFIAGSTTSVTLEVTFSNGCVITSAPVSFTKCDCLCIGSSCAQIREFFSGNIANNLITTLENYPAGKQLRVKLANQSGVTSAADQFLIKLNGTDIIDTGYFWTISNNGGCPVTNGYPIPNLSAAAIASDVQLLLPLSDRPVIKNSNFEIAFTHTVVLSDTIEIWHNTDGTCNTQGSYLVTIECI